MKRREKIVQKKSKQFMGESAGAEVAAGAVHAEMIVDAGLEHGERFEASSSFNLKSSSCVSGLVAEEKKTTVAIEGVEATASEARFQRVGGICT